MTLSSSKSSSWVHIGIAKPDCRFTVSNSSFLAVLIGKNSFGLGAKEEFPVWKEFDVDVVEYDVTGSVVPVVQVEEVTEVHGLAKRSCPLSLPEPRSSNKNERARALHFLKNYSDLAKGGTGAPQLAVSNKPI